MSIGKNVRGIVSRQRVKDFGEVLTPKPVVRSMLDLIVQEVERIDSTFLDPACGIGNFLVETLIRRLRTVKAQCGRDHGEYERQSLTALSSLYGIEIQEDSVRQCRRRLVRLFNRTYTRLFNDVSIAGASELAECIVNQNIVWGDFLTLMTMGDSPQPISFCTWHIEPPQRVKGE
jgi:hypothetical protein